MIDLDALKHHVHRSPFDTPALVRIALGSLSSALAVYLFVQGGLGTTHVNTLLPIALTVIGVLLVWPVFFRTLIQRPAHSGPTTYSNDSER